MAQEQMIIEFDTRKAEAYRQDGMNRALMNTESKNPQWAAQALDILKRFIASHSEPFMVEDVRAFAYKQGLQHPERDQAWGAIIRRACKNGLINKIGQGIAKDPTRHRGYTAIWMKR